MGVLKALSGALILLWHFLGGLCPSHTNDDDSRKLVHGIPSIPVTPESRGTIPAYQSPNRVVLLPGTLPPRLASFVITCSSRPRPSYLKSGAGSEY